MAGVFSIGYGTPDTEDEGSTLSAFWIHLTNTKSERVLNILTRGTIGLAFGFSLLSLAFLNNWIVWLIGTVLASVIYITFGALVEGEWVIETKNYTFLTEDLFVYAGISSIAMVMIYI